MAAAGSNVRSARAHAIFMMISLCPAMEAAAIKWLRDNPIF
jgi:hypothetical protein